MTWPRPISRCGCASSGLRSSISREPLPRPLQSAVSSELPKMLVMRTGERAGHSGKGPIPPRVRRVRPAWSPECWARFSSLAWAPTSCCEQILPRSPSPVAKPPSLLSPADLLPARAPPAPAPQPKGPRAPPPAVPAPTLKAQVESEPQSHPAEVYTSRPRRSRLRLGNKSCPRPHHRSGLELGLRLSRLKPDPTRITMAGGRPSLTRLLAAISLVSPGRLQPPGARRSRHPPPS